MRALFFAILSNILSGTVSIPDQEKRTAQLVVEVMVTQHNKGSILLALYNSEVTYMNTSYRASKKEVKDGRVIFTFDHIDKGTYGFSLFHDINGNDKLDRNILGIPKEPYGFSQGKSGTFGPPDFSTIQFNLKEDRKISVDIK